MGACMRAATRSQIRSIEKHTFNEYGMPSIVLMERAGQAVADMALNIADEDAEEGLRPHFVVLCGTGGNGGDGFVAARDLLFAGFPVTVFALPVKGHPSDDVETERAFLERVAPEGAFINVTDEEVLDKIEESIDDDAIVIDALFGIGLDHVVSGSRGHHRDRQRESGARCRGGRHPVRHRLRYRHGAGDSRLCQRYRHIRSAKAGPVHGSGYRSGRRSPRRTAHLSRYPAGTECNPCSVDRAPRVPGADADHAQSHLWQGGYHRRLS